MSNEVTKVELYGANNDGDPRSWICASGTAIAKGSLLEFTDGRVASQLSGDNQIFAGIASMGKSGSDYSTTVSAWTNGIFDMVASGTITAGDNVVSATLTNAVRSARNNTSSHAVVIGYALDTVADSERVNIRVNI